MAQIFYSDQLPEQLSPDNNLWVYNGLDATLTHEIYSNLEGFLDPSTKAIYTFERALQNCTLEMTLNGLLVHRGTRFNLIQIYEAEILKAQRLLDTLAQAFWGRPLSPTSPKQCQEFFYDFLLIPPVLKRAKGKATPTTDDKALQEISQVYFWAKPFVSLICYIRDKAKLLSSLKAQLSPDGKMRSRFSVAGTETGRFSAAKDNYGDGLNLQNQNERAKRMYIAEPGRKLAYIDLEQAESRMLAAFVYSLFGESLYLDACESDDLHSVVCKMIWPNLAWTDNLLQDKKNVAEQPFYRHFSYRDMAKRAGHGCLTAEHEVLTPQGWVSIAETPEKIMAFNNNRLDWDCPSHWENKHWEGQLYSLRGTSLSADMTSDHRVVFMRDRKSSILHEEPAELFSNKGDIPLGWGYGGNLAEPLAQLVAAYQCDGYQKSINRVEFHFHKERKFERIVHLAEQGGIPYERKGAKLYLHWNCPYPKHAGAYLLEWDSASLKAYVSEHKHWDGHVGKTNSTTISSVTLSHLEWLQTVGRLVGIGGNIQKPSISGFGSIAYHLQQNKRKFATKACVSVTSAPYSGKVYCPTVKGGAFLIRHKGKISITGNTNYWGQPAGMAHNLGIDSGLMETFQESYFKAFPGIRRYHAWIIQALQTTRTLVNPFGRKRIFFDNPSAKSTIREAIAFMPQSSIGDLMNLGMWKVQNAFGGKKEYVAGSVQPLVKLHAQVHDAILISYPERLEDDLLPQILELIPHPLLAKDREVIIPCSAETGWNWGKVDPKKKNWTDTNPDGLKEYEQNCSDTRKRIEDPSKASSILGASILRLE